jgi:hypothetical protein
MFMKLKTIITAIFILLFAQTSYAENKTESTASPVVNVVKGTHKFETIAEGIEIIHEFVIQNTGKTQLDITKVKPG